MEVFPEGADPTLVYNGIQGVALIFILSIWAALDLPDSDWCAQHKWYLESEDLPSIVLC